MLATGAPVASGHLRPTGAVPAKLTRLSAITLFSGAGGLDLGLTQAGFDVLAAVEWDPHACDTLQANFGERTVVCRSDVRSVDPVGLLNRVGLEPGELDLLAGGPPCQPFSQIGKRGGLGDERGDLVFEMVRFAAVMRPRAILIEQVKGVLAAKGQDGQPSRIVERLAQDFESLGYAVTQRVLNAADYGAPQLRQRLFVIATREGSGFALPEPEFLPRTAVGGLFPLQPHRTVGEALAGLASPPPQHEGDLPEDSHVDVTPPGQRRRIQPVPEGQWLAAQLGAPAELRQSLKKKDTTKFRRLSRSLPSLTLRCGEIFFHPLEDRYLTPREYLRLHGYPDTFVLRGPVRSRSGQARNLDQHRQVANSVPPPLARAVGIAIARAVLASRSSR